MFRSNDHYRCTIVARFTRVIGHIGGASQTDAQNFGGIGFHRESCFQGIPTLIIAVAGIDDAASVAIYGIVKSVMFSDDALWYQILQGPIAIVGGLGFGIMWGWLAKYVPEKGDVSIPFPLPAVLLFFFPLTLCLGITHDGLRSSRAIFSAGRSAAPRTNLAGGGEEKKNYLSRERCPRSSRDAAMCFERPL